MLDYIYYRLLRSTSVDLYIQNSRQADKSEYFHIILKFETKKSQMYACLYVQFTRQGAM